MRQTSRAVALLLIAESQAAVISTAAGYNGAMYINQFALISGGQNNVIATRVSDRMAPYNWCPTWAQGSSP